MTLGSIVVRLSMNTADFDTDSKRAAKLAEKRAKEIDAAFRKAGTAIGAALGAGLSAAGAGLVAITNKAIDFGDQIAEISNKTGVGAEALSGWAYAAEQSGASLKDLSGALPKLAKNLAGAQEEGSRLAELFAALNVATVDAAGQLRGVEDVLPELADRFKSLDNETTEAALAMELFGRSGAGLMEFLNNGGDGLADLTQRARELGVVLSDETAAKADEFNDRLKDVQALALSLGLQVAERLLPAMNRLVGEFTDLVQEGEAAAEIAGRVETVFGALATTFTVVDATVKGVTFDVIALYNALDGLNRMTPAGWIRSMFDGGSASASFDAARVAREMAAGESARIDGALNGSGGGRSAPINWIDPPAPFVRDTAMEDRLAGFLNNPTGASGAAARTEKTEAEKAAERLQAAYESTLESLERQQFMLGKTGEAAQLRYEIELGALRDLDPALQQELLTKGLLLDAEIAAREEAEKQAELDRQATEAFEDMNTAILEQIQLIGMSADEQEIWNNLAWAGVEAESARGQEIIENTRLLQQMRDQMEDQIGAMDAVREAGADLFVDLASGEEPLQSIEDALERIQAKLLEMIAQNLMDRLFGKQGDPGGGAAGDWLGNLFGAFFSGGGGGGGGWGAALSTASNIKGGGFGSKSLSTTGAAFPEAPPSKRGGPTIVNNFAMPGRYDLRTQGQVAADAGRGAQRALSRGTA